SQLGGLRDAQVQKRALACELAEHPDVGGLWLELEKREMDLTNVTAEKLRRFKTTKLTRQLEKLEAELTDPTARLAGKTNLRERVIQAVANSHAKVMERRRAINLLIPATLHRTRTAFKRFRYMIESLPPSVARPSCQMLSAMSDYQDALGKIQD